MRKKWLLHENWKVKILNDSNGQITKAADPARVQNWFVASVPGTIHTDLLNAGKIDEPFFADNEKRLGWIGESNWIYQTEFDLSEEMDKDSLFLVFDGLDTIAHIELNGQSLGHVDNMFRQFRFFVGDYIKSTGNKLQVTFQSPIRSGRKLNDTYGHLFSVRNEERTYLRKTQYSFGWDWGPAFPTVGIWRPVYLEHLDGAWIDSVRFDTQKIDDSSASVLIKADLSNLSEGNYDLKCDLSLRNQKIDEVKSIQKKSNGDAINRVATNAGLEVIEFALKVQNPSLWWPNGQGDQPLYNLQITLSKDGNTVDQAQRKVGIRTIKLVQQEDDKQVFYFRVNDRPVYLKGANWIPSDSFIPRIKDSTYQRLISMAKDAGMNVLRIWGGGIYEQPRFYELCDQLGILIWQDFMFACSSYPENDFYVENVRQEAKEKVSELQHHPSIAIWCGNNENEWIWYRNYLGSYKNMPGYKIFHKELKTIVSALDPLRPYWPTTPFGSEEDPNAPESGNRHSWDIWSRWVDYEEVEHDESLFVSEFGFQGPANINTLNSALKKENRHIQDTIFEFHNKQDEGTERLFKFLAGHLPVATDWEDFIYLTQLNQGFALKTCLDHWRGRWPETAGSIIWQLNDCWPVTSWSLVDSYLDPKMAYYFVQKSFSDPAIFIKNIDNQVSIKLVNNTNIEFVGNVEHIFMDLTDNQVIKKEKVDVTLRNGDRNQDNTISLGDLPESGNWILITTLRNKQDYIINRNFFTLKRWKHLKTAVSNMTIVKRGQDGLKLTSDSLALFVDLYHEHARFSDRGFIILPGEQKDLNIICEEPGKVEVNDIRIFTLNDYLNK